MKPDDSTLIAYADGELSPAAAASVEQALAESSALRDEVSRLRASRLPYRQAFAAQSLPPLPDALRLRIEAMASAARQQPEQARQESRQKSGQEAGAGSQGEAPYRHASRPEASHVEAPQSEALQSETLQSEAPQPHLEAPKPETPHSKAAQPGSATSGVVLPFAKRRIPRPALWLAAAFVAGAFCAGLVQQFAAGGLGGGDTPLAAAGVKRPWISVAAEYQQFYTRETLADVQPDPAVSARIIGAIRSDDGIAVRVPDLASAGLTFKSVDRLRYDGKPLVQIAYLPAQGTPVALCVMKDARPDQAISQREMHGMSVVTWRQGSLSYALIGKPDSGDLNAIARQIAGSRVEAMFAAREIARRLLG
ncbi:anti-sigma factor [Burkholderia sp. 3C]